MSSHGNFFVTVYQVVTQDRGGVWVDQIALDPILPGRDWFYKVAIKNAFGIIEFGVAK